MARTEFVSGIFKLPTPAIPKKIYQEVKKQYIQRLDKQFSVVMCPLDAPEITYFDHIEVFVSQPTDQEANLKEQRGNISAASAHVRPMFSGDKRCLLAAVPWPKESYNFGLYNGKYIQIEVQICPTAKDVQWEIFRRCHGKLWECIQWVINPYGLVCENDKFYLEIKQIRDVRRSHSRIYLTSDPSEFLDFLGLSQRRFWSAPFHTVNEMFEFVAQCRMFCTRRGYPQRGQGKVTRGQTETTNSMIRLRSPLFQKFVLSYTPACRQTQQYIKPRSSPKKILKESIERFKLAGEPFRRSINTLIREQEKFIVIFLINGGIPEVTDPSAYQEQCYRICLINALIEIIIMGDEKYGIMPAQRLKDEYGLYSINRVRDFIEQRSREVGDAAHCYHSDWCFEVQLGLMEEARNCVQHENDGSTCDTKGKMKETDEADVEEEEGGEGGDGEEGEEEEEEDGDYNDYHDDYCDDYFDEDD
ncbi:hypothetical protein ED733_002848 [Metarhizium rileyi]|uniref:Uncharacterized protein n=1 Tax=Metarhizium rileyi (strain RCEF 4871) TaxID=1649241 RepID=A0A5C6G2G3_METRR|nr:hypothetical protein ED733_002848 [Metarhizium rileyi]